MTHPGRLVSFAVGRQTECVDCGAEFVERRRGGVSDLACPWTPPTEASASCGRPYTRPERDQGREYIRDKSKKARRP